MARKFAPDRFDDVPADLQRVGAHRAPARAGRRGVAFAWAALATGLLVGAGVLGLALFTNSITLDLPFVGSSGPSGDPSAAASGDPSTANPDPVAPVLDPALAVTVLNGTETAGLAKTVGDLLVEQGWAGAADGVGTRANAATQDVPTTIVYYNTPANEAAARAMVQSLGLGEVSLSDTYPESPLTVVLGADYTPPAG